MNSLSKKLMLGAVGLFIAAATVVGAKNLVKGGDAEDAASIKKWHKALTQNTEDKVSGKSSFQGSAINIWATSPLIEIDPSKTYQLSGSLKSIGKDKGTSYLGLIMYDAKKRLISLSVVLSRKGSFTELAADAKTGDKVLKLKNCARWDTKILKRTQVAFNSKKDYSDLPNYNLSNLIVKLEKKGDVYEITLKSPIKKTFPTGTKVRQHYSYGGYQYCAAAGKIVPDKWTKYSAVIKGTAKTRNSMTQFWPGTKFVKVIVILNYNAKKGSDCKTLFDDITFAEVD